MMELNELFGAISKAQLEYGTAVPDNKNPFFKSKYADLATVIKATRPALSKHGLSVMQVITPKEEGHVLRTILAHSSGQYIESVMKINPPKSDIQSIGSYITYLRRYCYIAITGVVVSDDDDDGEAAMQEQRYQKVGPKSEPLEVEKISDDQYQQLVDEFQNDKVLFKDFLEGYKLKNLRDLPRSLYQKAVRDIRAKQETKKMLNN